MAKLSDLFGRKPGEPIRRNGNGDHRGIESVADVGSALGEENEALRNLLSDTGRKIGELDELKEAFDKIVTPFNATLRALEQEKSQTLALNGMLNETRASYETLRTEFYQIEKKATSLEAEAERLRIELELARETNRAHESSSLELSNEISSRRSQITELEHQLAQESLQRRTLSDNRRTLQDQLEAAEKHRMALEGELAAAREKLALLEDDKRSLQIAVDQALNETARLTRRLTESENTLTATRAQLGKVEASFAEAYGERGRLAAALDEIREQRQAEQSSLNMRLDALQHAQRRPSVCYRKRGRTSSPAPKKCAPSTASRWKRASGATTRKSG
jgi:chromosome segregation ATPase